MNFYTFKDRCQISQMMSIKAINVCLFTLKILRLGGFSFYHGKPLQTVNHTCGLALTAPPTSSLICLVIRF